MQTKKSRKKATALSPIQNPRKYSNCQFCEMGIPSLASAGDNVISDSLTCKYTQAEINACEIFSIERFMSGASKVYPGGFMQFDKFYNEIESLRSLKKLYQFQEIKEKITDVIKGRIHKDRHYLIHYQVPYYSLQLKNYSFKKTVKNIFSRQCKQTDDLKSTQADEAKLCKKQRNSNKLALHNSRWLPTNDLTIKNQSMEELKILTKKIDKMCSKFKNNKLMLTEGFEKKVNRNLYYEYEETPSQLEFKRIVEQRFSFISPPRTKSHSKSKKGKKLTLNRKKTSKDSKKILGFDSPLVGQQKKSNKKNHIFGRVTDQVVESPASEAYYLKDIQSGMDGNGDHPKKVFQHRRSRQSQGSIKSHSQSAKKLQRKVYHSNAQTPNSMNGKNLCKRSGIYKSNILQ